MTQFNAEKKKLLTFEEAMAPAMNIKDKEDAQQYLKSYISYIEQSLIQDPHYENKSAEEIAKINLGFYVTFYGAETQSRIKELFDCTFPAGFFHAQSSAQ